MTPQTATATPATPATTTIVDASASMDDFVESKQIPLLYPQLFSPSQWLWLQNQRNHNGLAPAFKKLGKTLFVNTKTLAQCLDSLQGQREAR